MIKLNNPPLARREFWIVFIVFSALISAAVILFPERFGARPARHTSPLNACINNLRQIDGAKEEWTINTHQTNGAPCDIKEVNRYIKGGGPKCPEGGKYTYGKVGELPHCTVPTHAIQ